MKCLFVLNLAYSRYFQNSTPDRTAKSLRQRFRLCWFAAMLFYVVVALVIYLVFLLAAKKVFTTFADVKESVNEVVAQIAFNC